MSEETAPKAKATRLAPARAEMRHAITEVIFARADLENFMAWLLQAVIGHETSGITAAIFFPPSSLESRIAIANDAFRELMQGTPHEERIGLLWTNNVNAIGRFEGTRNKVAHGFVSKEKAFHAT